MEHKPSIGRIVHYIEGDFETNYADTQELGAGPQHSGTNGTRVHPAIITRVWSDHCVNLQVFKDAKRGGAVVRTSVTMIETPEGTHNPNSGWRWPPRV